MIRLILSLAFLMFFACSPARADEHVAARIGAHKGYSRLVFEWLSPVAYHVNREGGVLTVTFARAGALDAVQGDANIASVTTLSSAGQPLSVKILSSPDAQFSDFSAGNRVIVDVHGGATAQAQPQPAPPVAAAKPAQPKASEKPKTAEKKPEPAKKPEPVKTTEPAKKPEAEKKVAEKIVPPSKVAAPEAKPARVEPVQQAAVEEPKPQADTNASVITVSVTEKAGLAAFVRNGNLWIVLDRPDIAITPVVTGPRPDIIGGFKRVEFSGGVAFVTKMPSDPGIEIYGDGGGLVWKLTMTTLARESAPSVMQRNVAPDQTAAGVSAFWPMQGTARVLDVPDADVGDNIKVVTVNSAEQFAGPRQETVDFVALRSFVGLAITAKADNLSLTQTSLGIRVSRPQGLSLSPRKDLNLRQMHHDVLPTLAPATTPKDPNQKVTRIFDFEKWYMGGLKQVEENQRILKAGMAGKDKDGKVQDLLTIAKMNLANDRGQEAIGFLTYAAAELPAIADAPQYKALRGAAEALSGKYEMALEDLSAPELKPYTELDYWRAYTLGWLGDWQQARAAAPVDASLVLGYPKELVAKIGVKLAEVALHAGDVKGAESILGVLEKDRHIFPSGAVAGMDYLEGEAHRQKGESDKAKDLWLPLTTGKDHLYRAKAGLALAMLQLQKGEIDRAKAIDRLEGLRYVWRGDELESRINYMLGKLYLEDKQYLKGFNILHDAAGMSPEGDIAREIDAYQREQFKTLLMDDKTITPLDSALVYEEFSDLAPGGSDGDALIQRLAEHLVEADLLPRAAVLLQKQIDTRLHGADQARVASRLAAIYLLDKQPQKAIMALDVAQNWFSKQTDKDSAIGQRRVDLMRARALSQLGRATDALAMLAKFPNDPDVNTLRADIAWDAGLWDQAAVALQDMILDQGAEEGKPLTQKQADLILNRAVALNLSGNKVALANLHSRFHDAMSKTSRAKLFDVVARPRESALLSDRQTLEAIVSEVDIFKDFLDNYRSADVSQ